jgi:hypothetical protein
MAVDYDNIMSVSPGWRRHLAARTIAHHAHDAKDLAELLDMLGLTAAEGREPPRQQPVPPPREPAPKLDPRSACRLTNLLAASHTRDQVTHYRP